MLSEKPWRSEVVMQFCAMQLLCFSLGLMMIGLLQNAGFAAFKPPDGFGAVLLGTLTFQGATWVLAFVFLRLHKVTVRAAFGFFGPHLSRALIMAVVFTIVILPIVLLLQNASVHLLDKLGWPTEEQSAVKLISGAKSWWMRAYLGVFAVVLAPVAEEFIFRGMLFPFFKQRGLTRFAWFGVSGLFALIHLDVATFVPLFVLALALTWLYEHTDNLLAPITAHALFNATNLGVLYFLQSEVGS